MSLLEDTSEATVVFSIHSSRYLCTRMFVMSYQFPFARLVIQRLLLASYQNYLLSYPSLIVMAFHLSQQL